MLHGGCITLAAFTLLLQVVVNSVQVPSWLEFCWLVCKPYVQPLITAAEQWRHGMSHAEVSIKLKGGSGLKVLSTSTWSSPTFAGPEPLLIFAFGSPSVGSI